MTASPAPYSPPKRDVLLWRGDNDPTIVWEFGDALTPDVLDGSDFELTVQWATGGDRLVLRSSDPQTTLLVDEDARSVRWEYTSEEGLAYPRGRHSYELRRLIADTRRTWVWGTLTVASGLGRD